MDLDPVGSLGFAIGEKVVSLEVLKCEDRGGKSYYVVKIQRECFESVLAALGDSPLVDSRKFEDRDVFFPNNRDAFASKSAVIIESSDGEILNESVVNFGQRAFWKTRIRGVVERIIGLVKGVFAGNPDVQEVSVMVDANGEDPRNAFLEQA